MKLANGMGSVYKLPGKRRRPWIARKTKGWEISEDTGKARQLYLTIGYFTTRQEALTALMEYNQNPYDLNANSITFEEVFEKWSEEHFAKIVPSAQRTWVCAYNHSAPLYKMRMKDIRPAHLEGTIRSADVGAATKQRMKSLYNLMYRYCLKNDIVDRDYAALCESIKREKPKILRIPFSREELATLWDNLDFPFVDMVLIGIYSGWRPAELSSLLVSSVDLVDRTYRGGLKTDAGRNRLVPIHPAVYDLVVRNVKRAEELGSDNLFNDQNGERMTYDKYRRRFEKINKHFNLTHRPHDTRHSFITYAKAAGVDEYVLKLIVGHAIQDVTEAVYTHRTIEQLRVEINKIPK